MTDADLPPDLPAPESVSRRQRMLRMLGGIVDQGIWSLSNVSLMVVIAKRSQLDDVGVMGLVLLLYIFVLGMVRAATGLPLIIRFTAVARDVRREGGGAAAGAAALLGLLGTAAFIVVGVIGGGRLRGPMIAVGVQMPLLMVQDVVRYYWLAERRAWQAARNDLVWLVVAIAGYPIAIVLGFRATGMAFAWAAGGSVAALLDVIVLRLRLVSRSATQFLKDHWDLSRHQLVEAFLQYGSAVLGVSLLGFVATIDAIGQIRLGQSLLGPIRTLLLGVAMAAVPEAVYVARRGRSLLRRHAMGVSIGLGGIAAAFGIVVQLIPDSFGEVLLSRNWDAAQEIALPLSIGFVGLGICFGPLVGLRALEQAATIVRCSVGQVIMATIGFIVGAMVANANGAALGQSIALDLSIVLWVVALWRATEETAVTPVPSLERGEDDLVVEEALAMDDLDVAPGV